MSVRLVKFFNFLKIQRSYHSSNIHFCNTKWRPRKWAVPENPNLWGPLFTQSDYEFADGRPAPFGANMRRRLAKQKEYAKKIVQLCEEVDFAVERNKMMKEKEEAEKKLILQRKLTSKGEKELS